MRQTRAPGSGGGRSGGRGSRSSRGAGNFAPTARQQAALGLLPSERLIWDSHMGAIGGPSGVPDRTLMDAIEVGWLGGGGGGVSTVVCVCVCFFFLCLMFAEFFSSSDG